MKKSSEKNNEINKSKISETEFKRICVDIYEEREIIYKYNPIGTREETLLWMLMGVLISYLSIDEAKMPFFNRKPTAAVYRDSIAFILQNRKTENFDEEKYLKNFLKNDYENLHD